MGLYFWFVVCCLLSQQGESMRQLFVCRDSQHCPRLQPCQRLSPPTPPSTRAPPPTSATPPPSKTLLRCSVYVTTTTTLHFPFLASILETDKSMWTNIWNYHVLIVEEYINYCRFAASANRILQTVFTAFSQLYIHKYQMSLSSTFLFFATSNKQRRGLVLHLVLV